MPQPLFKLLAALKKPQWREGILSIKYQVTQSFITMNSSVQHKCFYNSILFFNGLLMERSSKIIHFDQLVEKPLKI